MNLDIMGYKAYRLDIIATIQQHWPYANIDIDDATISISIADDASVTLYRTEGNLDWPRIEKIDINSSVFQDIAFFAGMIAEVVTELNIMLVSEVCNKYLTGKA